MGSVLGTTESSTDGVGDGVGAEGVVAEGVAADGVVADGVGTEGFWVPLGCPEGPPRPIESSTCRGSMVAVGSGVVRLFSGGIGTPVAGVGVPTTRGRLPGSTTIRAGFCAGIIPSCAAL